MADRSVITEFQGSPFKVNLGVGAPDEDQLRTAMGRFQTAAGNMLTDTRAPHFFQYGAVLGSSPFREEMAKFLTQEYDSPVDVNDVVESAGASQGLFLLANLMFGSGDLVFVDELAYFLALDLLTKDSKMKPVPVAMDEEGMIPQDLERALRENSGGIPQVITEEKPYWAMLYTVPTFHNPTGRLMSPERCQQIVSIARQYNLLVVCDDVYNLLYFTPPDRDGKSPKRMFAYDDKKDPNYKGNVVSNGTFSKVFSPGMRVGWMEAPQTVIRAIQKAGYMNSGGGLNHTMSHVVMSLIQLGLMKKNVVEIREELQRRCDALCDTLKKELPPSVTFDKPKGGYFVWVVLPPDLDSRDVLEICQKEFSINFHVGQKFSPENKCSNCLRLSFSHFDVKTLEESAVAVATAIKRVVQAAKL
jgi:DNA-binding transcriptional MocR family regulator